MCVCFNRVREAAMTSLMEVTLLLVQNEAELINANMYATCTIFVSYLLQLHFSPYKKVLLTYCIFTPVLSVTELLIEVHQDYTHTEAENIVSVFQRNLMLLRETGWQSHL